MSPKIPFTDTGNRVKRHGRAVYFQDRRGMIQKVTTDVFSCVKRTGGPQKGELWTSRDWCMQLTRIDASACDKNLGERCIIALEQIPAIYFRGSLAAIYVPAVGTDTLRRTEALPPDYQEVPLPARWNLSLFSPSSGALLLIIGAARDTNQPVIYVAVTQPRSLLSRQRRTPIKTFPFDFPESPTPRQSTKLSVKM